MRGLIRLVVLLALIGGVAFLTRPGEAEAERNLRDMIVTAINSADIDAANSGVNAVALGLCKLKPDECYELLRSGVETRFQDQVLFTTFEFRGLGKQGLCIGAFTTFFCPGGLQADA